MKLGTVVVHYNYVTCREDCGTVIANRTAYSHARGEDIDLVDVQWDDMDEPMQHAADDFSAIAGRSELLLKNPGE